MWRPAEICNDGWNGVVCQNHGCLCQLFEILHGQWVVLCFASRTVQWSLGSSQRTMPISTTPSFQGHMRIIIWCPCLSPNLADDFMWLVCVGMCRYLLLLLVRALEESGSGPCNCVVCCFGHWVPGSGIWHCCSSSRICHLAFFSFFFLFLFLCLKWAEKSCIVMSRHHSLWQPHAPCQTQDAVMCPSIWNKPLTVISRHPSL